jgi:hypothetical protein
MVQMQSMTQDETQLLSSLREAWTTYGPALRTKRQLNGGMSWRQIGKNEYLCRYVQDPATGKKLYTSLGRRSTETEMTYNVFHMRRDGARQEIQANKEDVLLRGRLLKAHGLARLPASSAGLLRSFWQKSVDQKLTLFCGASLLAYEGASEIKTPSALIKDEKLVFVIEHPEEDLAIEAIVEAYEDAVGKTTVPSKRGGKITLEAQDAVKVQLIRSSLVLDMVDSPDQADVLEDAFRAPAFAGLTVARDSQPVEIRTFEPSTFAMMASVMGRDDEIWAERAEFTAELVNLKWEFDPAQEAAFPALCSGGDGSRPPRM